MRSEQESRILEEAVAQADSIAIAGHIRPDGDCVGACLGLYNYLQENFNASFEKEITVYMKDIPETFLFLKNSGKPIWEFEEEKQYDLFIVLDCSSGDRLGEAAKYFRSAKHTLCFDHHISNSGHFTEKLVLYPDYSSTCEVLFTCMCEEKISLSTAEALYLGLRLRKRSISALYMIPACSNIQIPWSRQCASRENCCQKEWTHQK